MAVNSTSHAQLDRPPVEQSTGTLLVFSDDWGRHPSSCQHIIRCLLDDFRVIWVNTIGMRTPSLNLATVKRGFEKLFQWSRRPKCRQEIRHPNLTVLNPRMWPWFTRPVDRRINRRLLTKSLSKVISKIDGPITAVTTIPIVADLVGELAIDRWTYYCVDDFSVWPGLDQQTLKAMEADLIAKVDDIVAVSETLRDNIRGLGRDSSLMTHGVDLDFWANPCLNLPDEIAELESPLFVFWGVVDQRMDVEFIRQLSARMQNGTIALIGPSQEPAPALLEILHVRHIPPLSLDELPAVASRADVLLMPYIDAEVTRAMQPLKLKEYLATGKPAVVRDLPSTRDWADCADVVSSATEFAQRVLERSVSGLPSEQLAARGRLSEESWEQKAAWFVEHALRIEWAGLRKSC